MEDQITYRNNIGRSAGLVDLVFSVLLRRVNLYRFHRTQSHTIWAIQSPELPDDSPDMAVGPAPGWSGNISQIINRAEIDDSLEAGFADPVDFLLLLEVVLASLAPLRLVTPLSSFVPPPVPVLWA
jgi:hypothetical protein